MATYNRTKFFKILLSTLFLVLLLNLAAVIGTKFSILSITYFGNELVIFLLVLTVFIFYGKVGTYNPIPHPSLRLKGIFYAIVTGLTFGLLISLFFLNYVVYVLFLLSYAALGVSIYYIGYRKWILDR